MQVVDVLNGPYKLVLPEEMLPAQWDGVLLYRVHGRYLGVAEFSAAQGTIGIPQQLSEEIGVGIGDEIHVEPAALPKGTQITLRASEDLEWKTILESYLPKNYSCLQKGQKINVSYLGQHQLEVTALEPQDAVCIIDTDLDLILDVPQPAKEQKKSAKIGETFTLSSSPVEIPDAYLEFSGEVLIGPQYNTSTESFTHRYTTSDGSRVVKASGAVCGVGEAMVVASPPQVSDAADASNPVCEFCGKHIPPQSLVLHTSFCRRNTVRCDKCGEAFRSCVPANHWHCSCGVHETNDFYQDHLKLHEPATCACGLAASFEEVAYHRATQCPHRLHICRFCHLLLPVGEESAQSRIQGFSGHEFECGSKTVVCPSCSKPVLQRDLNAHLQHHDLVRRDRAFETGPVLCSNRNCPNIVAKPGQQPPADRLGLCPSCYGVIYTTQHDPDGKLLRSRLERRYVIQLSRGCGNTWCSNQYCASGSGIKRPMSEVMKMVGNLMAQDDICLCVDRTATKKATFLDDDSEYSREWRGLAISSCSTEADALRWLQVNAPRVDGS